MENLSEYFTDWWNVLDWFPPTLIIPSIIISFIVEIRRLSFD
jgi:hypothetical protein